MKNLLSTLLITACFLAPLAANEEQVEEGQDLPVQEKSLLCCLEDETTASEEPVVIEPASCSCCPGDRDSFVYRVIDPTPDLDPDKDVTIM